MLARRTATSSERTLHGAEPDPKWSTEAAELGLVLYGEGRVGEPSRSSVPRADVREQERVGGRLTDAHGPPDRSAGQAER